MKPLRFSRYAGSKMHFIEKFNDITLDLDKKIYVEPFFGSGSIFFNLDKKYDSYVINDANRHVMNAVKSFRDGDYDTYLALKEKAFSQFGDIRNNKESYYNFRNWFNSEYFNKDNDLRKYTDDSGRLDFGNLIEDKNPIREGFLFHFLMNSCINSLVRLGPNGFNQSYGNRFFFMDKAEFDAIQARLKDVIILCEDYSSVLDKFDSVDTMFFLDPPYLVRNEVGYQKTYSETNLTNFIEQINKLEGAVVYTDIPCDLHERINKWSKFDTKILTSISPLRKSQGGNQEVFFSNFAPVVKGPKALF